MASGHGAPRIALSCELLDAPLYEGPRRFQLFTPYAECLRNFGAIPFLIPSDSPPEDALTLLELADGLLLTGGDDVDLRPLGGPAPLANCKPIPLEQQSSNLALVHAAHTAHMPLFGVCLGMQMMGLAFNAPFIQDLDLAQDHVKGARHLITAEPGTHLATVIGRQAVEVASFHHQGLASPGEELNAAAFADDGTLEAVELPDADWALGVQWHPEKIPDSPTTRALFSSFVEAARAYRMQRA